MSGSTWQVFSSLLPEMIIFGGLFIVLLWGMIFPRKESVHLSLFVLFVLTVSLYSLVLGPRALPRVGMLAAGGLPVIFRIMVVLAASLIIFLSHDYLPPANIPASEYYLMILLVTLGMMITVGSGHLLLLFLGIELMSLGFALLAAFMPGSASSKEASLKYLMYSLTASAMLLFGLSIIYGIYGSWDLTVIGSRLAAVAHGPSGALALVLVIAGIGFKIGLVPFHMWIPDVYDGSPAPVAAFLSVGPKIAALAAASTLFVKSFNGLSEVWYPLFWVMGVVSMFWGNLAALAQRNLKRMMAYSSIAHVGYLTIGLLASARRPTEGLSGLAFYLFAYLFFNVGFFALIIMLEGKDRRGPTLEDISGIGRRQPFMGLAFTLFLLSLAGIPPTSGFMGKLWIFMAAVRADMVVLAVIGVLNSALASFYYLRVVYYFFMKEPLEGTETAVPVNIGACALVLACITVVLFGIWPNLLLEIVRQAALI